MPIKKRLVCLALLIMSGLVFCEENTGEFTAIFFKDGHFLENYDVVIDGHHKVQTDDNGAVFLDLVEGNHFLETKVILSDSDNDEASVESVSFNVTAGETTQIVVNLYSKSDKLETLVSEPGLKAKTLDLTKQKTYPVSGKIVGEDNKGVGGASLYVQGIEKPIMVDSRGYFKATLPRGRHTVSVMHPEFETKVLNSFSVLAEESKNSHRKIVLEKASLKLDTFVVVAPHIKGSLSALIEVRRNSSQVADGLGSEQISKAGDSDAASSLTRVTGLTIVDGRFVYIRGLGERYSNVLLNGVNLPSPDPTRRVVELDLFPSGILENIMVQKSYSADKPGSFGGGTVLLKTKDIPEKFFAKVSLGTRVDGGPEGIQNYRSGKYDSFGFDDGSRALPFSIRQATANGNKISKDTGTGTGGFSSAQLTSFTRDLPRNYNLTEQSRPLPPSLSLSVGDLYKYKGKKFGYLFSALYSNRWERDQRTSFNYDQERQLEDTVSEDISTNTINLSGMLNLGVNLGRSFDIRSNTLLLRKTTNRINVMTQASDRNSDDNFRDFETQWQERQLLSQILHGKHQLGDNKKRNVRWKASYSQALRYQPDSSLYRQQLRDSGVYTTSFDGKNNEKLYNDLKDNNQDYSLKFDLPLVESNNIELIGKVGGAYNRKDRTSRTQRFKFGLDRDKVESIRGSNDFETTNMSIEDICTQEVINGGGCTVEDVTSPNDRFSASQRISAAYIDSEMNLWDRLKVNAGVRFEKSTQEVRTFDETNGSSVSSTLVMNDYLPVVNTTLTLMEGLQLRSAYAETISRPDFKDLNNGSYFDDEKNRLITGNPLLRGTVIRNIDTRLEWYFGKGENISFSYFNKEFDNPIEEVAGAFDDEGNLIASEGTLQLGNIGNATASGLEIEGRIKFDFLSEYLGSFFNKLALGGNYSRINSQMNIYSRFASQVTNQVRPMQGQSPYVFNVNLDYDNEVSGTSVTALYNVIGRRIDAVGSEGDQDIYEEPFKKVDLVLSQNFKSFGKLKLKLGNILDPEALRTQDGLITERFRRGRTYSMSYTRTF